MTKITRHFALLTCWLFRTFDFTINAVLHPTFIRKLCYKMSSIVTFTFIQIFYQNCAFFTEWHQSCRVRLTASKLALFSVSDLKDENLIKKQTYMKTWIMQTLFWRLLNIFAKYYQNWSLQFRAIPFQSWAVFLRHSVVLFCCLILKTGISS